MSSSPSSRAAPAARSCTASATSPCSTGRGPSRPGWSSPTADPPPPTFGAHRLFEAHRDDFVGTGAAGGRHLHHLALPLADERPRDRRAHGDPSGADIGPVPADPLIHRPRPVGLLLQL